MPIPAQYADRYFFHFTHIENLDSIIKNGLLCTNEKNRLDVAHVDVAAAGIQERRSNMDVTCGPEGKVHDYVPCYFCTTNPMFLSIVNSKNIDQQAMIFFAFKIDKLLDDNVVFTDASANTVIPPNFYNDPQDLEKLDWTAIEKKGWKDNSDDERHRRMAEVLIFKKILIDLVDAVIVWNEGMKKEVLRIFEKNAVAAPTVTFEPFNRRYFYFTKFMVKGLKGHSLITGPKTLKSQYKTTIKIVIEGRAQIPIGKDFLFDNIQEAVNAIDANFSAIKELEGIFELETDNQTHHENVSDHTLRVVAELEQLEYYKAARMRDKNILKLSAYLHDIGKGPHNKWEGGIQQVYPDHPADAPKMLKRILTEDFRQLTEYEIRMICLLVTYHDLIGEIIGKNRNLKQLIDVVENEKDFDMLTTLNLADVSAIAPRWRTDYLNKIEEIRAAILQ